LAKALPGIGEMLRRSLRGDIEVRTKAQNSRCHVLVDEGELELALLNLGVNARDAMPDGGILSLSVRTVRLDGSSALDGLRGQYVVIELADTGVGIASEVIARVFEPFFTTKGAGKGTGLGLSQVYGFAKQSGGTATIDSKPGHGTTVRIYLPETDAAAHVEPKPAGNVDDDRASQKGHVLIVEDSEMVAFASAEYFEQLGYTIEHASNGADALRMLRTSRGYDLIFSDILMPGSVAGLELARIVRTYHSEIPILLATGFSEKAQEAISEGFFVLQKPYTLHNLSKAIRELQFHRRAASLSQENCEPKSD
jgi:two-component system, NtrC family, sensor kinase